MPIWATRCDFRVSTLGEAFLLSAQFKATKRHSVTWKLSRAQRWYKHREEIKVMIWTKERKLYLLRYLSSLLLIYISWFMFYLGLIAKLQNRSLILWSKSFWLSLNAVRNRHINHRLARNLGGFLRRMPRGSKFKKYSVMQYSVMKIYQQILFEGLVTEAKQHLPAICPARS